MTHDTPNNKAGFEDSDSFEEKVEKHNQNVQETMEKARNGETVNLTDMLADKEQLHLEEVENRG